MANREPRHRWTGGMSPRLVVLPSCETCSDEGEVEVDQSVQEVGLVATRVPCPDCNGEES